jgi:hypothetical protein
MNQHVLTVACTMNTSPKYFYQTMGCWRCSVMRDGANLMQGMAVDSTGFALPQTYSLALVTGSHECHSAELLKRVVAWEQYGIIIDSFTCFCETCMKITLHVQQLDMTHDQQTTVMYSAHYIQNQLCELERLKAFSLLPLILDAQF